MHVRRVVRLGALAVTLAVALSITCREPVYAQAPLPTTVNDQVTYLADRYANGLALRFGDTLSSTGISTNRTALVSGLNSLLTKPFSPQELLELGQWAERQGSEMADEPVDAELPPVTRSLLNDVKEYLARPPAADSRTHWLAVRAVLAQTGTIFDALRKEMAAQWADVTPEADAKAGQAIASQTQLLNAAAYSRISPYLKRPFTPAEMEELIASARKTAQEQRQNWDGTAARLSDELRAQYTADPGPLESRLVISAALTQYGILAASYQVPAEVTCTKQESQEIRAARAARAAAREGAIP